MDRHDECMNLIYIYTIILHKQTLFLMKQLQNKHFFCELARTIKQSQHR